METKIAKKRNTKQKAIVYQIVKSSYDHPTAEKVYERAKREISSISLGTVYRILKELVSEGKIGEIIVNSSQDSMETPHTTTTSSAKIAGK